MHQKMNKRIIAEAVPILVKVVEQSNNEKLLNCKDNISEKVKTTLLLSQSLFDDMNYTEQDAVVYIDILENLYGAEKGSLDFVKKLIGNKEEQK